MTVSKILYPQGNFFLLIGRLTKQKNFFVFVKLFEGN